MSNRFTSAGHAAALTRRDTASLGARPSARPSLSIVARLPPPRVRPGTVPLSAPSSTFETHRLVALGRDRLELRKTSTERAFTTALGLLGAGLLALGLGRLAGADGGAASLPALVPLGVGLAMIAGGVLLWRLGGTAVLDARAGEFRRCGGALRSRARLAVRVGFEDVIAVQRLTCRLAEEEARWTVHQLNLVRRDGSRVHVCSHVDASLARIGAERIARLVGVDVQPYPTPEL